jgi:hypothetical protein
VVLVRDAADVVDEVGRRLADAAGLLARSLDPLRRAT